MTIQPELLKIVEAYYIDFLQRVKDYEIVEDLRIPKPTADEDPESKPIARGPPGQLLISLFGRRRRGSWQND